MCHKVKHIGLASVNGEFDEVRAHLMKVNQWPQQSTADDYIAKAFELFEERSRYEWTLDISYLKQFGIDPAAVSPLGNIRDWNARQAIMMEQALRLPSGVQLVDLPDDGFDPFDHIINDRVA
jgi:hypothetical protein